MSVESSTAVLQEHIDYLQKSKREAVSAAIAAEREACAKIAEKLVGADVVYPEGIRMIAAAIRARGE